MKVTSLVENTSVPGFPVEHGLSLYLQGKTGLNVLFDLGQRRLFAENAVRLNLDIAAVDVAVISHGHYDHGGGLHTFLELNDRAEVYIHQDAFQPHYSLRENGLASIGLDPKLQASTRLIRCGSVTRINDTMTLFADVHGNCCFPRGNRLLFGPAETENDNFSHEQNLVMEENDKVMLFAGCAHNGMVNIIRKAEEITGKTPTHVFGGMHLVKSGLNEKEEHAFIASLAQELMTFKDTRFYTMHCTGTEQFEKLRLLMGTQIEYLSCGESIEI